MKEPERNEDKGLDNKEWITVQSDLTIHKQVQGVDIKPLKHPVILYNRCCTNVHIFQNYNIQSIRGVDVTLWSF